MKILITAATPFELAALESIWPGGPRDSGLTLEYFVSGVGPVMSAILLSQKLAGSSYNLILNIGIAGSHDRQLQLGEVVWIQSDFFGDVGVEDKDGSFIDLFALGLHDPNEPPFHQGRIKASFREAGFLNSASPEFFKAVKGVTLAKAHGSQASIDRFAEQYDVQVESMEGASIAWVAFRQNTACLQIRAISNYVEPRNRDSWRLDLALSQLSLGISQLLETLEAMLKEANLSSGRQSPNQ